MTATAAIIRESAALNKAISKWISTGQEYHRQTHLVVCSSLWHACEHGDPIHLNRIYLAMTADQQTTLRAQVGKAQLFIANGEEMPDEAMTREEKTALQAKAKVFNLKAGEWSIVTVREAENAAERRKAFSKFVEGTLAPAESADFPMFSKVNTGKTLALIGDVDIIKRIENILKLVYDTPETETRQFTVSPRLKKVLEPFRDIAERFSAANGLDDKENKRKAQPKARGNKRALPKADKTEAVRLTA